MKIQFSAEKCPNHSASCASTGGIIPEEFNQSHTTRSSVPRCDFFHYTHEMILFLNLLSKIERTFCSVFIKRNVDINKFWSEFYGVVNLSDYSCNQNELSVLGKGLKFCPTPPKYCHGAMKESINKFFRSASLKLIFANNSYPQNPEDILENSLLSESETDTTFEHKELKLPSMFNPPMFNA